MSVPPNLLAFDGNTPDINADAWIAPTATVIGAASIGADASVFYGAVVRADRATITLGAGSNLQDLVVVHADPGYPTTIGGGVTVGHGAILHGCTIEDGCLIGMGAIILNGAVIGAQSLVAAGTLVLGDQQIPPRSLVAGSPGKVRRELSETELQGNRDNADRYVELARRHRAIGTSHSEAPGTESPTTTKPG